MRNPTITFETNADIETDVVSLILTDVARYEGVIDVQLVSSTKVLSYKVRAFDPATRTLTAQVWDDGTSEGTGELLHIDVETFATVHVY